jgi:hypothetical protein
MFLPLRAPAVAEAGVAVSPLEQWVVVEPGQVSQFSLSITNVARRPQAPKQSVTVQVVDFAVSKNGTLSFGEEFAHDRSAVKWITLDQTQFVLEPDQAIRLKGTVRPPLNADGDYWAAALVILGNPNQGGNVRVMLRTACGVFVRVKRRNYVQQLGIDNVGVVMPQFASSEGGGSGLTIVAETKNKGVVSFKASGKAAIYDETRRRVASVPLYARRRRVLPGHSRNFEGVLPSALPSGKYALRVFLAPDEKSGRRAFEQTEFEIGEEVARRWESDQRTVQRLGLKPQKDELAATVTPGRFTALPLTVVNQSRGTMAVRCRLWGTWPAGWLALEREEMTLAPAMQRAIMCRVSIPTDAVPAAYTGTLVLEAEKAGLTDQDNQEAWEIPVSLTIEPRK